jgi:hypothetical protein
MSAISTLKVSAVTHPSPTRVADGAERVAHLAPGDVAASDRAAIVLGNMDVEYAGTGPADGLAQVFLLDVLMERVEVQPHRFRPGQARVFRREDVVVGVDPRGHQPSSGISTGRPVSAERFAAITTRWVRRASA